jgi:two-component system chemotaxis response regulator CheY
MAHTIMAVDDSQSIREIIKYALAGPAYSVMTAASGEAALERITQEKIDCLITDLHMPGIDGIELIKRVRALPNNQYIPILMLTTDSSDDKKLEGKRAGATGWLMKPFTVAQLAATIKKVLG